MNGIEVDVAIHSRANSAATQLGHAVIISKSGHYAIVCNFFTFCPLAYERHKFEVNFGLPNGPRAQTTEYL